MSASAARSVSRNSRSHQRAGVDSIAAARAPARHSGAPRRDPPGRASNAAIRRSSRSGATGCGVRRCRRTQSSSAYIKAKCGERATASAIIIGACGARPQSAGSNAMISLGAARTASAMEPPARTDHAPVRRQGRPSKPRPSAARRLARIRASPRSDRRVAAAPRSAPAAHERPRGLDGSSAAIHWRSAARCLACRRRSRRRRFSACSHALKPGDQAASLIGVAGVLHVLP